MKLLAFATPVKLRTGHQEYTVPAPAPKPVSLSGLKASVAVDINTPSELLVSETCAPLLSRDNYAKVPVVCRVHERRTHSFVLHTTAFIGATKN